MNDKSLTLRARLLACWPTKVWVGALLGVAFNASYHAVQRWPLRAPHVLTPSTIDRLVPFQPGWAWVYQSFNVLLTAAWLATSRAQLARYAGGFAVVMLVGLACFIAYPTTVVRPPAGEANVAYRLLVAVDRPLNCMPSEHVALATYTTLFARAVTRSRTVGIVFAIWTALIAYATLAIRQHVFVDLIAGAALGIVGHAIAWGRR